MKLQTVFRRVIKAAHLTEHEIAIIIKARVFRDLQAKLNERVKNFLALFHILQAAFGNEFPRFLPQRTVRLFEVTAHLHQRFFFAPKIHRLRADEFLILLRELRLFGFQRHVFRTKKFDMIFYIPVKNFKPLLRQFIPLRMRDVNLFQRKLSRLELRFDVLDKIQIRLLRVRVIRMAGHGDVSARCFFIKRSIELTPIEQPAFERGSAIGLGGTPFQLVKQRRDLRPVAEVKFLGNERTRPVRGQFSKRQ